MTCFINSKGKFSETKMKTYLNTRAKLFGGLINNGVDKNLISKYVITKDSSIIKCNVPKEDQKNMLWFHVVFVDNELDFQMWLRKNKPSKTRKKMIKYYETQLNKYTGVN